MRLTGSERMVLISLHGTARPIAIYTGLYRKALANLGTREPALVKTDGTWAHLTMIGRAKAEAIEDKA